MGKSKRSQKAAVVETEEVEVHNEVEAGEELYTRTSKFKEATMNSTRSIHPPPDELWQNPEIDHLIKGFDEENKAPAVMTKSVSSTSSSSAAPTHESTSSSAKDPGTLNRISRTIASFFGGGTFSLGKRKAGNESAENGGRSSSEKTPSLDRGDAKERAEAAYAEAKALGILPTPKVFVRPVARARGPGTGGTSTRSVLQNYLCTKMYLANIHTGVSAPATPSPMPHSVLNLQRTPTLYKSPSKRDLQKQKKLSKRVSDLEHRLSEARKELAMTLSPSIASTHPIPSLPTTMSSPPPTETPLKHVYNVNEAMEIDDDNTPPTPSSNVGKIVKKRKALSTTDTNTETYKPVTTDSDFSLDSEREPELKRPKATPSKMKRKSSSRLAKKSSSTNVTTTTTVQEQAVVVVPDARVGVPAVPVIPKGIDGKRAAVGKGNPDGYGGFAHEMF
jgi:hypothetical protein